MKKSIQTSVTICSAHRLLLDYESKCRNLHGHNWRISLTFEGETNDCGMLIDFVTVKNLLLDRYDHKTILGKYDPLIPILKNAETEVLVIDRNPTAENLCDEVGEFLAAHLPDGVKVSSISVEETSNNYAWGIELE